MCQHVPLKSHGKGAIRMSDGFPKNDLEALAMLYLQNQDLSEFTPGQILEKYKEALTEMKASRNKSVNDSFLSQ